MQVGNIMILVAMAIFVVAAIIGSKTPDTWKYTGITWSLLILGLAFFVSAMVLS